MLKTGNNLDGWSIHRRLHDTLKDVLHLPRAILSNSNSLHIHFFELWGKPECTSVYGGAKKVHGREEGNLLYQQEFREVTL